MIDRTNKILIGKDIGRDPQVIAGASIVTISASTGLADGEIVVLDKNKNVLAAGATITDTDIIFIVQAVSKTFDYTPESGGAVTGARKQLVSDPIKGANVRKYIGKAYVAKAEQTAAVTLTGLTSVAGTEYIVRVIYKDIKEHPGQFTQTYRFIATAANVVSVATFCDAIVAKVNAHPGRRVQATDDTTGVTLTGREIPESCTSLDDIDEFDMVDFDVKYLYVDSSGNWQTMVSTSTTVTYTGAITGGGNWEQIRDIEKAAKGYLGNTNKTHFPVLTKEWETVVDETYDMVIIEHDQPYRAPNYQGYETAPITTILALPDGASQTSAILSQLNPWMASCPGTFTGITF